MNPVTSQPGVNHYFMFPSPPTPPRTDNVSFDFGLACCLRASYKGGLFGVVGGGVGSLLEVAASGTLASSHLPLGLCCAFGFGRFWQDLDNQLIEKKLQLDYAYLQDLQKYNVQLRDRIIMLLTGSSLINSTGNEEDRKQQEMSGKVTDISQAVSSRREPGRLLVNSARSEDCENLRIINSASGENSCAI